ncbi:hypothetical protein JVU11DRAFT_10398 [Chiua virens]|nr:hypothetical protein JVU11DRAFT_10398 [Chiua virens]
MQALVALPPYYHHANIDNDDTEPDDEFIFHRAHICELEKHLEPGIDKISPDEDDRAAEAALGDPVQERDTSDQHKLYHEEEDAQFGNANPRFNDSLIERLRLIRDQQQLTIRNSGSAAGNTEITIAAISGHSQAAAQDGTFPSPLNLHFLTCHPLKFLVKLFSDMRTFLQASLFYMIHSASWYAHLETILIELTTIQLWEALMTWRSTIKSKACEIVPQFYDVGSTHDVVHNQLQASMLIKGAEFLRNGIDDKGSTNNMAHLALAALITGFFYLVLSLNSVFPEVFLHEIPKVAMCLVATVLWAALDEYTQTGT